MLNLTPNERAVIHSITQMTAVLPDGVAVTAQAAGVTDAVPPPFILTHRQADQVVRQQVCPTVYDALKVIRALTGDEPPEN